MIVLRALFETHRQFRPDRCFAAGVAVSHVAETRLLQQTITPDACDFLICFQINILIGLRLCGARKLILPCLNTLLLRESTHLSCRSDESSLANLIILPPDHLYAATHRLQIPLPRLLCSGLTHVLRVEGCPFGRYPSVLFPHTFTGDNVFLGLLMRSASGSPFSDSLRTLF